MTAEQAVLRWEAGQLRTADGAEATDAQAAKARRYLRDGLIKRTGTSASTAGWGMPGRTVEHYALDPVPGCRQQRKVTVTEFYDAAGNLTAIWYDCDCQRAAGGTARSPGACSHALAVYLHRRDDTREA